MRETRGLKQPDTVMAQPALKRRCLSRCSSHGEMVARVVPEIFLVLFGVQLIRHLIPLSQNSLKKIKAGLADIDRREADLSTKFSRFPS